MLALEREKERGVLLGSRPLPGWMGVFPSRRRRETALLSNKQKFNTLPSIRMSTVCTYSLRLDYE